MQPSRNVVGIYKKMKTEAGIITFFRNVLVNVNSEAECQNVCTSYAQERCADCVGYRYETNACVIYKKGPQRSSELKPININMLDYMTIG